MLQQHSRSACNGARDFSGARAIAQQCSPCQRRAKHQMHRRAPVARALLHAILNASGRGHLAPFQNQHNHQQHFNQLVCIGKWIVLAN